MIAIPDVGKIRNVALISHGGGGKTTLAETLLFNGHAIDKRGDVTKGTAVMTTEPEEVERGITITTHTASCTWRDHLFQLIDTPGYFDFLELTRGALEVVGGAVVVFSGLYGVKPETDRLWSMIEHARVPVLGFVNKMDQPRADFIKALGEIEKSLGVVVLPLTIPIGAGEGFMGIVDLIPMTAWSAKDGLFTPMEMPAHVVADAKHYRTQLVEKIVEADDDLLEAYLESGQEPSEEQLHIGLREATITRRLLPVFCGSAAANIGVRALANGIAAYLPSPLDKAAIKPLVGVSPEDHSHEIPRQPTADAPFSAVVFKTIMDPFSGKLSVLRVFSGVLEANHPILNGTQQVKERGGNLFRVQGKELSAVEQLVAGEIGAVAKLEKTRTGDTLCAINHPIHYPRTRYLPPPTTYAVEVESKNEDKVNNGLSRLAEEDPTLRFFRDEGTNEFLLAGMGQTHLMVALDRLKRKYGSVVTLKAPRVAYLETVRGRARVQGKLKKQSGGRGQYGDCWIEMESLPRGEGFLFEDKIFGGAIPRQYIPSVEKGVREALNSGIIGGFPVVDVKVTLVDGTHHSVDSSDYAFKVAGSMAFKKGMEEAQAVLLEPIMAMSITVPDTVVGDVIGDLNSRRGRITGVVPQRGGQLISAEVPMAEVLEYGNLLNGMTSGRGLYTMTLASYQEVPSHIARKVMESRQS